MLNCLKGTFDSHVRNKMKKTRILRGTEVDIMAIGNIAGIMKSHLKLRFV